MGDMTVMRGELSNTATDHRQTAVATSVPPSKIVTAAPSAEEVNQ